MKAYCENCEDIKEIYFPIKLRKDKLNKGAWNDILCKECNFVIATLSNEDEGDIIFENKENSK